MTEFDQLVDQLVRLGAGVVDARHAVQVAYDCADPARWRPVWLTAEFVADLARRCAERTLR